MQKLSDAPVSYLSIWYRIFLPVTAAIYMIVQGSQESSQFINGYYFLFSLAYCYLCCSLIINLTHYFVVYMDQYLGWYLHFVKRIVYQLSFSFMMIGLNYLLVRSYFYLMNYCFNASGYMTAEFHTSIWMVFAMNLFYFGWFFASNFLNLENKKKKSEDSLKKKSSGYADKLKVKVGDKSFFVDIDDIECINMADKTLMVIYDGGKESYINQTVESVFEKLDPEVFHQINRSTIYPMALIQNYKKTYNYNHEVILFIPMKETVSNSISRERFADFKKAFKADCNNNR